MDFTFTNLSATTADTYWMVPYCTIEAEEMESEMDFTFTNLSATTVDTYWMVPYRTIEAEEMESEMDCFHFHKSLRNNSGYVLDGTLLHN